MLYIPYQSEQFPAPFISNGPSELAVTWNDLLWAAITVGRPDVIHAFQYGKASLHEALFRWNMIKMALQQEDPLAQRLTRTPLFNQMDPTEKGAINYFLGLVICKLFASRLLDAPWTLHLDVFRSQINPTLLSGRSRPDMVAQCSKTGDWHAFECKGRASYPPADVQTKAKQQAQRLVKVGTQRCVLHVGAITYFNGDTLEFYWRDPPPAEPSTIELSEPDIDWNAYYDPLIAAFAGAGFPLIDASGEPTRRVRIQELDIEAELHPTIARLVQARDGNRARALARELQEQFRKEGFQPDGIKINAGETWRERRLG